MKMTKKFSRNSGKSADKNFTNLAPSRHSYQKTNLWQFLKNELIFYTLFFISLYTEST